MQRVSLVLLVLLVLLLCAGCAPPDLASGGSSPATLRTVYGTTIPATPRPPYQPTRRRSLVAVDTIMAGTYLNVAFGMELSQTLHLLSSPTANDWLVIYDPAHWQNISTDTPLATDWLDFYAAIPAAGWLLTPLITGTLPITVRMRYTVCIPQGCMQTARTAVYTIDVHE